MAATQDACNDGHAPDRPLVRQLLRRPSQSRQPAHPRDLRAGDPVERDRAAVVHPGAAGRLVPPGHLGRAGDGGGGLVLPRASRVLGLGMLAVFVAMGCVVLVDPDSLRHAHAARGPRSRCSSSRGSRSSSATSIEGRKPSFLTDLTYLLIGPAWVLAKLLRKLGNRLVQRPPRAARGLRAPRPRCSSLDRSASPGPATS